MSQCFYRRGEFIMFKTKHFGDRIQQRGILNSTIELAQEYGQIYGDKYILGKKEIIFALKNIDSKRKKLIKALDQGGIIAVESGGSLITAYQLNSYKRSK